MKMFIEFEDHISFLEELVIDQPKEVIIASFGLYAGITYKGHDTTEWGDKWQLRSRDLLESMQSVPSVKMLIGTQEYSSCRGKQKCIACEMRYARTQFRLISHAGIERGNPFSSRKL